MVDWLLVRCLSLLSHRDGGRRRKAKDVSGGNNAITKTAFYGTRYCWLSGMKATALRDDEVGLSQKAY